MGVDIFLDLQVRRDGWWHTVETETTLGLGRNYDAFGLLFGVRNHANHRPVAAARGVPPGYLDRCRWAGWGDKVEMECENANAFGHTWLTPADVRGLDLDAEAADEDERLHHQRMEGGRWVTVGKFAPGDGGGVGEWEEGGVRFRNARRRETVGGSLSGDYRRLLETMRLLGLEHGDSNVRAVVWFS